MSPEFPFEYKFVDDIFDEHYKNEERLTKLLGYFAIFSIFIACLGCQWVLRMVEKPVP